MDSLLASQYLPGPTYLDQVSGTMKIVREPFFSDWSCSERDEPISAIVTKATAVKFGKARKTTQFEPLHRIEKVYPTLN